jgi:hypothetical protein
VYTRRHLNNNLKTTLPTHPLRKAYQLILFVALVISCETFPSKSYHLLCVLILTAHRQNLPMLHVL